MVTSNELLEFVEGCTEEELTLDSAGDVLSRLAPVLEGEPLATAIKAIASLAVAERDAELQNRSLDAHLEKQSKDDSSPVTDEPRGYM